MDDAGWFQGKTDKEIVEIYRENLQTLITHTIQQTLKEVREVVEEAPAFEQDELINRYNILQKLSTLAEPLSE